MDKLLRGALSARFIFRASLAVFVIALGLLGYVFYQANSFEQPTQGGTYREGIQGNIATMNPLFAQRNPAEEDIVRLIYSGLTKYDPKQQKIVPDLATFQTSADYKEYVFRIHPDAVWHDGQPVTADDVLYTYNTIKDPAFANTTLKTAFEGVKVNKIDDKTVQFVLPTAYSFFPTATTLGILPKHIWENVSIEQMLSDPQGQHPVGSGPFMIEGGLAPSQTGEQIVTLVRNEKYYGDKPYLDRIILQFYPTYNDLLDKKTSLLGMKSIPFEFLQQIRDMMRFDIYEIDEPRYYAALMNVENETLQDKRTREGLSMAINRDELLAPFPFLKSITSPFSALPSDPKDDWKTQYFPDRAKGSLYDAGWRFPTDAQVDTKKRELWQAYLSGTKMPATKTASGTVIEATTGSGTTVPQVGSGTVITDAMLSGATLDGKRLIDVVEDYKTHRVSPKGKAMHLRIVTLNSSDYLSAVTERIAKDWEEVGVSTEVTQYSSDDLLPVMKSRDYDVIVIGQDLGYDGDIFPYWHSSAAKLSGFNLSNFKNTTLDSLLDSLRKPASQLSEDDLLKQRTDLKTKIGTLLQDEMPAIFLFQKKNYFAVDKKIKNVYIQNLITPKDRFAYAETWYESSGKQLRDFSPQAFFQWVSRELTQ